MAPPYPVRLYLIRRSAAAAPVGSGDDLEVVPVGIEEVHAPAAVVVVDLACTLASGIGPVLHLAIGNPAEDPVEVVLAHEEGVVDGLDALAVVVDEVEAHPVVGVHDPEVAEAGRAVEVEQ